MLNLKYLAFILGIVTIKYAFSVSISQKCEMSDGKCKLALYRSLVQSIAGGVPELNIPAVDPLLLKDITAMLPEGVQFILADTVAKGLKDCIYDNFQTYLNRQHSILNITCALEVEGQYKVVVPSKVMSDLGGSGEGGEFGGTGKLKIENMHMNFDFPLNIVRKNDDIYIQIKYYDGLGVWTRLNDQTVFSSDNLGLGDKALNVKLVDFLNENSKKIEGAVAVVIAERTNEFYHAFCDWFFNSTPANKFIDGDLSEYVTK